jgi:hypothetical protein
MLQVAEVTKVVSRFSPKVLLFTPFALILGIYLWIFNLASTDFMPSFVAEIV